MLPDFDFVDAFPSIVGNLLWVPLDVEQVRMLGVSDDFSWQEFCE